MERAAATSEVLTLTETPSEDDKEAERRFTETLGRLANTPPTPHEPLKKGREPKPAPKGT